MEDPRTRHVPYEYEVLELVSDDERTRNGVKVRYTCLIEDWDVEPIELFVAVPFQKMESVDQADELINKKCEQRAPVQRWRKQMIPDTSGDTVAIGDELAKRLGVKRVESRDRTDGEGNRSGTRVSRQSGSEGERVGDDGNDQSEAPEASNSAARSAEGRGRGRRSRQ